MIIFEEVRKEFLRPAARRNACAKDLLVSHCSGKKNRK